MLHIAEPVSGFQRSLRHFENGVRKVRNSLGGILLGPHFDFPLLQALEKRMDQLDNELSNITRDVMAYGEGPEVVAVA